RSLRADFPTCLPPCWACRRHPLATCAAWLAGRRPATLWLPHTRLEALSPARGRVPSNREARVCGLATAPCPPPGLGPVAAQRRAGASAGPGRGRGRPPAPGATLPNPPEPARG